MVEGTMHSSRYRGDRTEASVYGTNDTREEQKTVLSQGQPLNDTLRSNILLPRRTRRVQTTSVFIVSD